LTTESGPFFQLANGSFGLRSVMSKAGSEFRPLPLVDILQLNRKYRKSKIENLPENKKNCNRKSKKQNQKQSKTKAMQKEKEKSKNKK
jgi:hypothetical protein